ncbi:DEAD/DEAH box helicase, partial [bacterium]|nr:DEAD/DEAH box helicase [bacterium]
MRGKTKTRSKSKKKPEDFQNGLETPIQYCPGVGPKRAFLFSKLNIYTIADLFVHFPRAYEDYHTLTCIKELKPGHIATLIGTVTHVDSRLPKSRSKVRHIINAVVDDSTGSLTVVWFNQPYLKDKVKQGARLLLHGKAEYYDGYLQMSAPKIQEADENAQTGIAPLYPLTDGLTQPILRKVMRGAFERYSHFLDETLPEAIRDQYAFPTRQEAFRILHLPNPGEGAPIETIVNQSNFIMPDGEEDMESHAFLPAGDLSTAWGRARQRLVFEEFFMHQLVLQAHSGRVKKQNGIQHIQPLPSPWQKPIPCELAQKSAWPALFIWHLPFPLTKDQQAVCQEFEREMAEPTPMNRLLQGDVGSGKTVVSIYAMIVAVAGGRQAALMAPTEILARQHADTIRKWTDFLPGLTILVLSGNMKAAERKHALQSIADGSADIVVGTHALFQDKVHFVNLGLVVVDEQHKFGVNQGRNWWTRVSIPIYSSPRRRPSPAPYPLRY